MEEEEEEALEVEEEEEEALEVEEEEEEVESDMSVLAYAVSSAPAGSSACGSLIVVVSSLDITSLVITSLHTTAAPH